MTVIRLAVFAWAMLASAALAQTPRVPPPEAAQAQPPQAYFVTLPMLDERQVRDLVSDIAFRLETRSGYVRLPPERAEALGPYPRNVVPAGGLARDEREYIRFGYLVPPRLLPQLWVQSLSARGAQAAPNRDVDPQAFEAMVRSIAAERSRILARLKLTDLESRNLVLSYADVDSALFSLRAMGYSAITETDGLPPDDWYRGDEVFGAAEPQPPAGQPGSQPAQPDPRAAAYGRGNVDPGRSSGIAALRNLPSTIAFHRLPLVVRVPSTEARNLGLVGADMQPQGYYSADKAAIPSTAAALADTVASGTSELMVLFHPDYPEQFHKVRQVIRDSIDRPARQVLIEGLVLEVSQTAYKELGVQWDWRSGSRAISIGAFGNVVAGGSTLGLQQNRLDPQVPGGVAPLDVSRILFARIQALVSEDKAEVLSRPSVVTLDNRQATIRVGNDVPIQKSDATETRVSASFDYRATGIMLNVRPRVSDDGQEISMLIDATVSDTVAGQQLRAIDPVTRAVIAEAPMISTRRVQTYARIRDNMPLIIGGLMSKRVLRGTDRVPLLGSIPIIGALFGSTRVDDDVREVIIVLTPTVVTEDPRDAKSRPKDDPRFDMTGTFLFKERNRIGAEDVVDSATFRYNERFLRVREAANRLIDRHPSLAAQPPFSQVAGARVPAESIFVVGMMSRMLDRLNLAGSVPIRNLRVFEDTRKPPIKVEEMLEREAVVPTLGKALALTFRPGRAEPASEIRIVESATRESWRRMLWELNQPDARGERATILIQDAEDLRRLQLAVLTHNTVLHNGGEAAMTFDRWLPGRVVHLQEVTPAWERILDADMARYFFISEYYYAAFVEQHSRALDALDQALRGGQPDPLPERRGPS